MIFLLVFWISCIVLIVSVALCTRYIVLYLGELATKRYTKELSKEEECNTYLKFASKLKFFSRTAQISAIIFVVMLIAAQFVVP